MIEYNALLILFLSIFVSCSFLRWLLRRINIRHLRRHGNEVPEVFMGEIDADTLSRMSDYTIASSGFAAIESVFDDLATLVILLSGFLPWFAAAIMFWQLHFVFSGLIFLGGLALIGGLLELPFNAYSTFVIEKRFGFSTIDFKTWVADILKGVAVSAVVMTLLAGLLLALLYYVPQTWWFWTWLVFAAFQLLMLWLYPVVIAPMFNKYEPVKDEQLRNSIMAMMSKADLKIEGVYQVDEGRRSRHTNAYFTGLGKTRRIVLYDTLLVSHSTDEIMAVLAHEIGHWKKKHIIKQLAFAAVFSLLGLYMAYLFINWTPLYRTFGFLHNTSFIGLFLLGVLAGPLVFILTPFGAAIARKFEREADDFAFGLVGTTKPLQQALKRLARDNLANLHPHPVFSRFYYSHPPLAERIARLQAMEAQNVP